MKQKTLFITGGAGFIGSNFVLRFAPTNPTYQFVVIDALTYAGNINNLGEVRGLPNFVFEHADIRDSSQINQLFEKYQPDLIFHFAAESHVDRSISGPSDFMTTNILGTFHLLEACRSFWKEPEGKLFHHVSTDEVFGSLGKEGYFAETTAYDPSSPYSASKAASDHLVRAYHRTYSLPVVVTNCSNNYGPRQFPEKLIPVVVQNCLRGLPLPIYGKGENIRDWLYVVDHCEAIWLVAHKGNVGETYNIGGQCELTNLDVVKAICSVIKEISGKDCLDQITFVQDRLGHDLRYAIDTTKIHSELGWTPTESFESGLKKTVQWYIDHPQWTAAILDGTYKA